MGEPGAGRGFFPGHRACTVKALHHHPGAWEIRNSFTPILQTKSHEPPPRSGHDLGHIANCPLWPQFPHQDMKEMDSSTPASPLNTDLVSLLALNPWEECQQRTCERILLEGVEMNMFGYGPLLVDRWAVRRVFARHPFPGSIASTVPAPQPGPLLTISMFPPPGAGSCMDGTLHIKVSQVTWPSHSSPREWKVPLPLRSTLTQLMDPGYK